jgi:hypothetical protein
VPAFTADLVDQNQPLTVCLFQFPHDLTDGSEDRAHRKGQAIHAAAFPTSGPLAVADVVQPRITNRTTLLGVIELLAVIRQKRIEASPSRVREEI